MFRSKASSNFQPPILGRLLASPTNIRQSWIGLPDTNNLAHLENSVIAAGESSITLALAIHFVLYRPI